MGAFLRLLIRPFCRHKNVIAVASYNDDTSVEGRYRKRWVWRCNCCGKEFLTRGRGE